MRGEWNQQHCAKEGMRAGNKAMQGNGKQITAIKFAKIKGWQLMLIDGLTFRPETHYMQSKNNDSKKNDVKY